MQLFTCRQIDEERVTAQLFTCRHIDDERVTAQLFTCRQIDEERVVCFGSCFFSSRHPSVQLLNYGLTYKRLPH